MKLSKEFILSALPTATIVAEQWVEPASEVTVSIDSRTLVPGELFVALAGPTFDGHDFVGAALERGACGALIATRWQQSFESLAPALRTGKIFILVDDTQAAFVALAKAWRQQFSCPVVGITGSVGKTTTKEMVRSILTAAGRPAYVSFKNYNNLFGVCYNLLRVPSTVSVIVLELGINDVGEMQELADIARPTIGVITNVGTAHLEGLKSVRTVAHEKRQLFAFFGPTDVGIVFGDQPLLADDQYTHPVMLFGRKRKNQVRAQSVVVQAALDGSFITQFDMHGFGAVTLVRVHSIHDGFINNALAAAAVGHALGIPVSAIVSGLASYRPVDGRFQVQRLKNNMGLVINDCYNANPESMRAALAAFAAMPVCGPKIAVLGDMLELGKREMQIHRTMGRSVSALADQVQKIILVGARAAQIQSVLPASMSCQLAHNWHEAQRLLEQILTPDCLVLVKASHGMHLEFLVNALVAHEGE